MLQQAKQQEKQMRHLSAQVEKLTQILKETHERQENNKVSDVDMSETGEFSEDELDLTPEQRREIAVSETKSLEKMLTCNPADDLKELLTERLNRARAQALKYKPGRYQLIAVNRRLEKNLRATRSAKQDLEVLEEKQSDLSRQMQAKRLQLQELQVRHEALQEELMQATKKTFAQVDTLRCADVTGLPAEVTKNPHFVDLLVHPAAADFTKAIAESLASSIW